MQVHHKDAPMMCNAQTNISGTIQDAPMVRSKRWLVGCMYDIMQEITVAWLLLLLLFLHTRLPKQSFYLLRVFFSFLGYVRYFQEYAR